MIISRNEAISFYTHAVAFAAALAGTLALVLKSKGNNAITAVSLIYGLSVSFLFLSSSLYHAFKKRENESSLWRRLDHLAIFFMIAGTYTPISWLFLPEKWKWGIIIAEWLIVAAGFVIKIFFLHIRRWIYTSLYLIMGWLALIPVKLLVEAMNGQELFMLFGGAASFTAGAVIYALKKPDIVRGFLGFHEIFHIFTVAGAVFHYALVYCSISAKL